MSHSFLTKQSERCYQACILTLPWVGMGVVYLVTGVDTGAGFQPSYVLLALAYLLILGSASRDLAWQSVSQPPQYLRFWLVTVVVLLISYGGLLWRPADVPAETRLIRSLKQTFQWFVMTCFAAAPLVWTRSGLAWERLGKLLAITLIFEFMYSMLQAWNFYYPLDFYARLDNWFTSNPSILSGSEELYLGHEFVGMPRLRGTMCEPLYLGNYLLLVLPMVVLTLSRRRAVWSLAAMAVFLLVATWARGSYLATGLAGLVCLILIRRGKFQVDWRPWLLRLGLLALLLMALVMVIWGPDRLLMPWQRLLQSFDQTDWSNLTRMYSMQAAWRAFLLSPVVGVGWGQFGYHFAHLVDPLGLQSQFAWPVVNNLPLQILCETGLLGFSVFLVGGFWLTRQVWQAVSPASEQGQRLGAEGRKRVLAAAVAVVGVWSQLLTFSQYNLPHIWVSLGLLLAALVGDRYEAREHE